MIKKPIKKQSAKTRLLKEAHEMAQALYDVGAMDNITMRQIDIICLPVIKKMTAHQIKAIRQREKVSQTVFASFLNTSVSTIKQWEQGKKNPQGTSLKLLNLVKAKGLNALL